MPDTSVGIVAADGTTKQVDTFTQLDGDHREAIVVGDATNADTARVLTAPPAGTEAGMLVRQVGSLPVPTGASTFRTQILASTVSVVALAFRSNGRRVGASFYNATSGSCSLTHAATSAIDTADLIIPPGGHYELPSDNNLRIVSDIAVIWAQAATGTLRVTDWYV